VFARYDIRPDPDGWTVYDVWTARAVEIDARPQEGLSLSDADALALLLSRRAAERRVRETSR
jgi:hypothetical protein